MTDSDLIKDWFKKYLSSSRRGCLLNRAPCINLLWFPSCLGPGNIEKGREKRERVGGAESECGQVSSEETRACISPPLLSTPTAYLESSQSNPQDEAVTSHLPQPHEDGEQLGQVSSHLCLVQPLSPNTSGRIL